MLRPECKPGDKESDLLITTLINSDGDKAADARGSGRLVQAGQGDAFSFAKFLRKGQQAWVGESKQIFLWMLPSWVLSAALRLLLLEKATQNFQLEMCWVGRRQILALGALLGSCNHLFGTAQ